MTISDDEDESLAQFLESEVLAFSDQVDMVQDEGKQLEVGDNNDKFGVEEEQVMERLRDVKDEGKEMAGEEESRGAKRIKFEEKQGEEKVNALLSSQSLALTIEFNDEGECASSPAKMRTTLTGKCNGDSTNNIRRSPRSIETSILSKIPPELLHHILKFLSSEDLIACSLVCFACDGVWCSQLKSHVTVLGRSFISSVMQMTWWSSSGSPTEFKEYYIQMQAAKRSQAPLPSQINDRMILDKTVTDQVSIWKKSKGLGEKTGNIHVCDDTCREVVLDPTNGLLVCTISGHCFDRMLSPDEMEPDVDHQQAGATDEAAPFMGSGRFARAYLLGYNCDDETELEAALRFC